MLDQRLFKEPQRLRHYAVFATDPDDLMDLMKDLSKAGRRPDITPELLLEMLQDRNLHLMVIRAAGTGRIVATGQLYIRRALSRGGALIGEIDGVVRRALPEYKGKGLGEAISRALEDQARALGVLRVRLHTSRENAALMYERLGFKRYGTTMYEKYLGHGPALAELQTNS